VTVRLAGQAGPVVLAVEITDTGRLHRSAVTLTG
jgi:hypothetical protein